LALPLRLDLGIYGGDKEIDWVPEKERERERGGREREREREC